MPEMTPKPLSAQVPPALPMVNESSTVYDVSQAETCEVLTALGTRGTSQFQDLLQQLAECHEREVSELRVRITALEAAPEDDAENSQGALPEADLDTKQVTGDVIRRASLESADTSSPPASMKGFWTEEPPKFAAQRTRASMMVKLNRKVHVDHLDAEANGDDLFDEEPTRSRYLLDPSTPARLMWDICGMFLIGYDLIAIPFLAFDPEDNVFTLFMGWLAMIFWTLDMGMSVNTGMRLADGNIIMDRGVVIKSYIKTWLIIDLLVVVPDWTTTIMELLGSSAEGKDYASMTRILRVLRAIRILRLLRLLKLKKLVNIFYDSIDSEHMFIVVNLVRMICIIVLMNHYVACVWYAIGTITMSGGSDTGKNWLEDVGQTPVFETSLGWRYATSLHWSITQFTPASMDVYAVNLIERVYSILILFWALVALSSFIGSVTTSMTQLRNFSSDKTKNFWLLRRYLKENSINLTLRDRVLRYAEHQADKVKGKTVKDKVSLLASLSDQLKREIASSLFSPIVADHPLFNHLLQHMPKIFQRICNDAMRTYSVADSEYVFRANEEASYMYFLKSGHYEYMLAGTVREPALSVNEWVCEAVLWATWRYRGDLTSLVEGDLLLIIPDNFAGAMRLHPRPWHFGRLYASKLISHLNNMTQATDLTFEEDIGDFASTSDIYDDIGRVNRASP
eukprot:TRINITY_DN7202_c0_g1_i3.p1 TRINITY_DN7202_c0_g1~~TRINITY_DN7202_c0_g1_i3.p1  ORF type:complete len:681 (-),score=112.94 TRINITY_DN7202_c0_g1_i3:69-2111(-)